MSFKQLTEFVLILMVLMICINSQTILPATCNCYTSTNELCYTRGCSSDVNSCSRSSPAFNTIILASFSPVIYSGCTCPGTSFTGFDHTEYNGIYRGHLYDYSDCSTFGSRANNGKKSVNATAAAVCCNFCCNLNDELPTEM